MNRRQLLRRAAAGAALASGGGFGPAFLARALAQQAVPGESPYGPLQPADPDHGLMLPAGFTGRVIANALQPVADTGYAWHIWPDGQATFPTDDGGWILASNSEAPVPIDMPLLALELPIGKVDAIRFAADATIVDAYPILEGSRCNCAGGVTPWGTWLSCEEWELTDTIPGTYEAGKVWECDPTGVAAAVHRPLLGHFKHEMATVDPVGRRLYLTEDLPDGRFYRFTPTTWGDLSGGVLEAAQRDAEGHLVWLPVPDPACTARVPTRMQVPASSSFDGGEGCLYVDGKVYVSTKGDNRVWVYDTATEVMQVLYDAALHPSPVLTGVDNLGVHHQSGDILVAEDGGDMEIVLITPDLVVAPLVRATGPQHGFETVPPIPTVSEITGLTFNPDGTRLYFSSERGYGIGITYEVTGPFRGSRLDPAVIAAGVTTTTAGPATTGTSPGGMLPPSGGSAGVGLAGAAAAALAAAAVRLRRRATEP